MPRGLFSSSFANFRDFLLGFEVELEERVHGAEPFGVAVYFGTFRAYEKLADFHSGK